MDKCPYCGAYGNKNLRNCWFCGKELPQAEPPSLFRGGTESKRKLEESSSADDSIPELKVCPHCGEKSLFYNFVSGEWECLNKGCESHKKASESAKLKEAKSAKAKRRASSGGRAWFGNLYYDAKSRKWRNPARGGLPMRKFLLVILLLASLATIPYGGYLLYEHRIGLITGGVLLLADVAALIWLASLLRRYWVPFGSFIAVFLLTGLVCSAACAYGGVEPFAGMKGKVASLASNLSNLLPTKVPFKVQIVGFQRLSNDHVVLYPLVKDVDKDHLPEEGQQYRVLITDGGRTLAEATATITRYGSVLLSSGKIPVKGIAVQKMLSDLDAKYEEAKREYDIFVTESTLESWRKAAKVLIGQESYGASVEWAEKAEAKAKKLEAECNKWDHLRNGRSCTDGSDIDSFCRKYLKISIKPIEER